jgi:hypothetical protein
LEHRLPLLRLPAESIPPASRDETSDVSVNQEIE